MSGCATGCAALVLILVGLCAVAYIADEAGVLDSDSGSVSQTSTTSGAWSSAGGNIWTGVKLYYGPSRMYVGEVLGGCGKSFGIGSDCPPPWTGERMVLVRMKSGSAEWKSRDAIIDGPWYVRNSDPALSAGRWAEY